MYKDKKQNTSLIPPLEKQEELDDINDYPVDHLVNFLKKSHYRFLNQSIPKIEQSFLTLKKYYENNHNLTILFNLFFKFQIDFRQHITIEEKTFFPYIETLYNSTRSNVDLLPVLIIYYGKYSVRDFAGSHEGNECYLTEIIFLLEQQDELKSHPMYNLLLNQLCHFDNEIRTHSLIEDTILVEKVIEIENVVEQFINQLKD